MCFRGSGHPPAQPSPPPHRRHGSLIDWHRAGRDRRIKMPRGSEIVLPTKTDRDGARGRAVSIYELAPADSNGCLARILPQLKRLRSTGPNRWEACCPAHEDRNPSFGLQLKPDKILLNCQAGCTIESVCAALGITPADLFLDKSHKRNGNGNLHSKRSATDSDQPKKIHPTAEAAAKAVLWGVQQNHPNAKLGQVWKYPNDVMCVVRVELPGAGEDGKDDKTYKPIHRVQGGWRCGDPAGQLPLYRIDELPMDGPVYVAEGEKCADAAATLGLFCTTSAHGAKSASKSDWTPCAGREVPIFLDNNKAGEGFG